MEDDCGFFRDEDGEKEAKKTPSIPSHRGRCMFCDQPPLDAEMEKTFGIAVCTHCSRAELKFVTKTTCMQDYLLTAEELRQFGCLSRPNPRKGSWNDMQLYLEDQIKKYAIEKHGALEAISKLKEERQAKKKAKKLEKVNKRVKELKRKTFIPERREKHVHRFVNKGKTSVCECGMEIEEEEL